jgi:hypothetical protein
MRRRIVRTVACAGPPTLPRPCGRRLRALAVGVALAAMLVSLVAGTTRATGEPRYRLDQVGLGELFGGSDEARELLESNGFVVTDEQFEQVFTPYINPTFPVFITADSAWHTYAILLEEGRRQLETAQARLLLQFSRQLVDAAMAKADGGGPYKDLALFAAVGLVLQDREALDDLDDELKPSVAKVVSTIHACCPKQCLFFELPTDPERFKPCGFHDDSEAMQGCYAARQWYGLCDFRLRSDDETERAVLLARLVWNDTELRELWLQLTEPQEALAGESPHGDVELYARLSDEVLAGGLSEADLAHEVPRFRVAARKVLPQPPLNDQVLNMAGVPEGLYGPLVADEVLGFRLLPPRPLPHEVLFDRTTAPQLGGRVLPSGLDVVSIGPLASEEGRLALAQTFRPMEAVESMLGVEVPTPAASLHVRALETLALLQAPVPVGAPEPLQGDAWRTGQLWAQLGAWTELLRLEPALPKVTAAYPERVTGRGGTVAPYPEFFSALGELCRETAGAFAQMPLAQAMDTGAAGRELLEVAATAERTAREDWSPPEDQEKALRWFWERYMEGRIMPTAGQVAVRMAALEPMARKCAAGEEPTEEELRVLHMLYTTPEDVSAQLRELAGMCEALARIATEELTGELRAEEDAEFVDAYGVRIARLHGYGETSWLKARDDFAGVVRLFGSAGSREDLYAGLGRPEALYVIAPMAGQPVLHQGAVLSYRELTHPAGEMLTDAAWREMVASGQAAAAPLFTASFRAGITQQEIVQVIRSGGSYAAVDLVESEEITAALIERLREEEPGQSCWWARNHLFRRAADQHVPDLIDLMEQTHPPIAGYYGVCIGRLDWEPSGDRIVGLLDSDTRQLADAGAYVLSQRPEQIPAAELLARIDAEPVRKQRLICFLLSRAPDPGEGIVRKLVACAGADDAGLRYTAVRSLEHVRAGGPEVVAALTERLADENTLVAAAAAYGLRALGADESAEAMLEALGRVGSPSLPEEEKDAVQGDTLYAGALNVMVLSDMIPEERRIPVELLGVELMKSLAEFGCAGAVPALLDMVGRGYAAEALAALARVDPEGYLDRALGIAADGESTPEVRVAAIDAVAASQQAGMARRLAPLLEEATATELGPPTYPWRIWDAAAVAIADLLGWEHEVSPRSMPDARKALLARALEWSRSGGASTGE